MKGWLLVLPLVMVLLAGCASNAAPAAKKEAYKPPASVGVDDPGKGKIVGSVTNDEAVPLAGASVLLFASGQATPVIATTDNAGSFAFLGLDPGVYLLVAQKLGYEDKKETNLQVEAGGTLEKVVALTPLPSTEPFSETVDRTLMISGYGLKNPVTGPLYYPLALGSQFNKNSYDWKTSTRADAIQNVVGEAQWQNQQALGGNMLFALSVVRHFDLKDADFARGEKPSPVNLVANKATVDGVLAKNDPECRSDSKTCHMEVYVYPGTGNTNNDNADVAFALQQNVQVKVTTFYRMDAPKGYSAF